jgi:hypothetical protein
LPRARLELPAFDSSPETIGAGSRPGKLSLENHI